MQKKEPNSKYLQLHNTMVSPPTKSLTPQKLTIVVLLLFCITISSPVYANTFSSKLDQSLSSQPTHTEIKCGSCPCGSPCDDQLLSPPPPSPPPLFLPDISSPTPPESCDDSSPLPPPPPPSSSRPPPTPPPPRFIYVTGVPGDAYAYYYSAAQNRLVGLLVLAGLGALSVTMLFG
ncbi:hypothetical protein JHK86_005312 [Glycine max]|nr:hypothetical protein JHK86_005312 [Glycine max]